MLQKKDVEWVKKNRALHARKPRKPMSNRERVSYFRIRKNVKETLEALTTLLKNMPEQQLEQTFNKDNVAPFLKALFALESDNLEKRRKRVIELWSFMLNQFSAPTYGYNLIGEDIMQVLTSRIPQTIQAIYYATYLKR